MKKAIQIRTVSQWHLLKQLNDYLGKRKVPEEVMRKIYHILCSKELGKKGFLILCMDKLKDDWYGIEEAVGMYPNKIKVKEDIDEILTRRRAAEHGESRGKKNMWGLAVNQHIFFFC